MKEKNPKIKVFVVDDHYLSIDLLKKSKSFRESTSMFFGGSAGSGEECLEKLKDRPVDLVLMDIDMPGINGIETAKRLLKIKEGRKQPRPVIIFLTGYNDFDFAHEALSMRASLIGKMVGEEELVEMIERIYFKGEIIINPNPKGMPPKDNHDSELKTVIENLLTNRQIQLACQIRNGKTAEEIVAYFNNDENFKVDVNYINNQKREIKNKLSPLLKAKINAASLGAIIERSGLCDKLDLNDLDPFLPKFEF